jgi:hypothetical protein
MPEKPLDDDLVVALRAQFQDLQTVEPHVLAKLLGTKSIAPWYREYKQQRALEQSLPDQWADVDLPPEAWAWAVEQRRRRSEIRAKHAAELGELAKQYKQKTDIADARRDTSLGVTNSPLMDLIEAGFEQLPLAAQAVISGAEDREVRAELLEAAIQKYRVAKLQELYPGGINFSPGVGPASSAGA